MVYYVQQPPTHWPALPDCVGNPVRPEATGNWCHCQVGIANEIWEAVHGRAGLDQGIVVNSLKPRSDGIVGNKEVASRFRFAPTSHRTKFEDGSTLSLWENAVFDELDALCDSVVNRCELFS